ncbi:MAG: hypothetical protein IAE91_15500 [Ignavibacteriaceae bacterium]|nr:hypothetical protein [Ignavibacteriaceae bacterium]
MNIVDITGENWQEWLKMRLSGNLILSVIQKYKGFYERIEGYKIDAKTAV